MPLLSNVTICIWMVVNVVTSHTCRRRYFIDLERYVTKRLDDLSKNYFTFLFCCSRTEHKSMIICCNVGRDCRIYTRFIRYLLSPIVERYRWYSRCIIRRNQIK